MGRSLAATGLAACVICALATVWLGSASGLFAAASISPPGWLLLLGPYPVLGLMTWWRRRDPADVTLLLAATLLVGSVGVGLLFSDWYGAVWTPRPTIPNPWRPFLLIVAVRVQWPVVALAVAVSLARRLRLAR